MSKDSSFNAVKDFIGERERYYGKVDATVITTEGVYIYNDIEIQIHYDIPYMQMKLDILWEEDTSQPFYKSLGLHGTYNTNYQNFIFFNNSLQWEDGDNKIIIKKISNQKNI